jgi:hypothetical protein
LCCKTILSMWARNIDSRSRTAKQLRFKSALVPIRLFQNPIPRLLYGDFCNTIPLKADIARLARYVRLVPCVDGSELARLFFTFAGWSVQPCVRPVSAAHKAAGHNALRGSGPGQKPAFDNAVAHVGCPDRRIGRLCITCCPPSQPSHHAECRRDLGHAASATGSL